MANLDSSYHTIHTTQYSNGSKKRGTTSIAGKHAFFSDLFSTQREETGGAPYNYRVRLTITLDKVVGEEGANFGSAEMGFHPLKNHNHLIY